MKNRYRLSEDEGNIFSSARNGDPSSVKHALRLEPYLVSFQDECGNTPLHWGARSSSPEIVKLILSCGADPNTRNDKGETPLDWAIALAADWRPDPPTDEVTEILEAFIQVGADIVSVDKNGRCPLHNLALFGRITEAGTLIENGVNPDLKDAAGLTPLHWAAVAAQSKMVTFLIDSGANVDARNNEGYTPLQSAVCARIEHKEIQKHVQTIEQLILLGADLTVRTKAGKTLKELAEDKNPGRPQIADVLNKYANSK